MEDCTDKYLLFSAAKFSITKHSHVYHICSNKLPQQMHCLLRKWFDIVILSWQAWRVKFAQAKTSANGIRLLPLIWAFAF